MKAIDAVQIELERARRLHGPMRSCHEGYAVLLEEVEEPWAEIKKQHRDPSRIRKEAVQVGAMALRFIEDTCPPPVE